MRPRLAPCDQSRHLSSDNLASPTRLLSQRARVRPWHGVYETFATPRGPRLSNAAGVPRQALPRDHLSAASRDLRRRESERARAQSLTKQTRAHDVAVQLVATHGTNWLIEDCSLTPWAKLCSKSLAAFAPGMVAAELAALTTSRGGRLTKVATGPTALSSHCLCGRRTQKGFAQRVHIRGACGFSGDRDLVSAALGTCVTHIEITDLTTARVDYARRGDELDSSTAQSTKGPGSPGPAKAAHELALRRNSPLGLTTQLLGDDDHAHGVGDLGSARRRTCHHDNRVTRLGDTRLLYLGHCHLAELVDVVRR